MNLDELKKITAKGESETVEFKASTGQRKSAVKTVCAMLNANGGYLFFGVKNNGLIAGQEVSEKTTRSLAEELQKIEPPAFPDVQTVHLPSGHSIIALLVQSGSGKPYIYDGRPYVRRGPTTSVMPKTLFEQMLLERLHASRRWENEPVPKGFTTSDLNTDEIMRVVESAQRLGRLEPGLKQDIESILRGLGLIHEGNLLNAAAALFGKTEKLRVLFPQFSIRLARFRGKNRLGDFLDNRQYLGNAFELLRQAQRFLADHVPIAGRVVPGRFEREDRPLYPPLATREALANALCHRDYIHAADSISVAMYDNRLEVASPGELHFGMQIDDLIRLHESRPWNPIMAGVFYRAGIIEKWGMGTLKILDWCKEGHNPSPEWREQSGYLYIIFLPALDFEKSEKFKQGAEGVTGEVTEEVAGEVLRLLAALQGEMKRSELQKELDLKHEEHFRQAYLVPAIEAGVIEMTIPDKPKSSKQKYRVTKKGKELLKGMRSKDE